MAGRACSAIGSFRGVLRWRKRCVLNSSVRCCPSSSPRSAGTRRRVRRSPVSCSPITSNGAQSARAGSSPCAHRRLHFLRTQAFAELAGAAYTSLPVRSPGAQSSNTVVFVGDRLLLKGYRRLHSGINPELEIGRFLTEVAHFAHSVPVVGAIEYEGDDGLRMTLALLQGYVTNQGDAWGYTLNYLQQFFEHQRAGSVPPAPPAEVHAGYLALVQTLARRTAELHAALSMTTGDAAFDPEPVEQRDLEAWTKVAREAAALALERLEARRASF